MWFNATNFTTIIITFISTWRIPIPVAEAARHRKFRDQSPTLSDDDASASAPAAVPAVAASVQPVISFLKRVVTLACKY